MRLYALVGLTFLFLSQCADPTRLDIGFTEPENPEIINKGNWDLIPDNLQSSFVSIDTMYDRDTPPDINKKYTWTGTGWKGEKIHTKMLLWSSQDHPMTTWKFSEFKNPDGKIF